MEQVLVPELKPGDVVARDNLKPHQSEAAVAALEVARARDVPLPPWSPDMTPIEEMISKVKGAMRSMVAWTAEAVDAVFASGLQDLTPQDIFG
ncbi:hypothetical protein OJF2_32180 [Aquisphaera giovannonii]|uniref:Tc1-like transposase DDE domain-containing protein n=1 Tax=Aquisphaera giovannonii TaxID=406548 RepID=A0A5B9W349_9BACT|nr:hypothetical protein OJF2_32180 [Aquisphaera giovannonii]